MANLKISELTLATNPTGEELLVAVQGDTTKKIKINQVLNYITPTSLTVSDGETVDLGGEEYDEVEMIRLHWDGENGSMTLNLPDATVNTNRVLRFISNGGFETATRVELTAISGQTIDGSTSSYTINKEYEGIQLWSDGVEWFIIQKKA
jgi:hypothetical protein